MGDCIPRMVRTVELAFTITATVERWTVDTWRAVMEDGDASVDDLREISRAAYHARAAVAGLRYVYERREALADVPLSTETRDTLGTKADFVAEFLRECERVRASLDAVLADVMTFAALSDKAENAIKRVRETTHDHDGGLQNFPLDELIGEAQAATKRAAGSLGFRMMELRPRATDSE